MSFANNKTKPNNIDLDSSQTLDNKTLAPSTVIQSGATITTPQIIDPSRLDVKKDTLANLQTYASSATNGQFVFATDTKTMFQVVDGALTGVGGDSAGINYAEGDSSTFENGIGDWVEQTPDLTITNFGITLRGNTSGRITKGTNGVLNYVSLPFTIDSADLAKILTISFDKSTSANYSDSGDNNFYIRVYDEDKSAEIRGHGEDILAGKGVHSYRFQTDAASTNYSLRIYCNDPSATSYNMNFDNVVIGPQVLSYGSLITDWETFAPNTSWDAYGTSKLGNFRRVGDSLELEFYFVLNATPAGNFNLTLPDNLIADTGKVAGGPNSGLNVLGTMALRDATTATNNTTGNVNLSSTTQITAMPDGTNSFINASVPFTWASNDNIKMRATVPIQGWSSNAVSSEDLSGREIVVVARGNGGTSVTSNTTDIDFTETRDTTSSWDGTTFTAPETGDYKIEGLINTSTTNSADIKSYIDGSFYQSIGKFQDIALGFFNTTVKLEKGEVFSIKLSASLTLSNSTTFHHIHIAKLASPQTILETETVAARYETNAAQLMDNGVIETVNYDTKSYDTHNAVTVGASWVFTAPVSGFYSVKACATIDNSAGWAAGEELSIRLFKNGSQVSGILNHTIANSDFITITIPDDIELNKGDTISVRVKQESGANENLIANTSYNYVSIARIK